MAEGYSAGADCQDDAARHAPDDPARDVSAKKWPPRGAGCIGGRQPSSDMGFGGRGLAPEAQTLLRSEAFVPSRCCFLTVGGLSWLVMPERGMTLPERVAKFLRDGADTAYCDGCIRRMRGLAPAFNRSNKSQFPLRSAAVLNRRMEFVRLVTRRGR